jgi:N-sulfoglucosamine sulfohydrolase
VSANLPDAPRFVARASSGLTLTRLDPVMKFLLLVFLVSVLVFRAVGAPPNVVIFIGDDISFDDFACTGNPDVLTPNIDQLASTGIRFNQFYLTASSCSPSRNSIMTGRYPHNTGAAELHTQPPDHLTAFPEWLRQAGYFTAHAGKYHMGEFNGRAFDRISRRMDEIGNSGSDSWVQVLQERPRDRPFFLWFAALDAHRDWGPNDFTGTHRPESLTVPHYLADAPATRADLARYYDEVHRFDVRIGQVVAELRAQGVLENTLIVVMADNGRPFPHSKAQVNDRGMKSPFILHWPAQISSAHTSEALLSAIDLAPTVLEVAGVEPPSQFQGRSFLSVIRDPARPFRTYVFAEQNWHDYEMHQRMVRHGHFLYVRNARPHQPRLGPADSVGSPSHADLVARRAAGQLTPIQADLFATPRPAEELYDLRHDPEQLVNVAARPDYRTPLEALRAALDTWTEQTGDTTPGNLTRDWYEPLPGYIQTLHHGVRGEMPGASADATRRDHPGPF